MTLEEMAFENIVGKGENAGNQHFLLFPKCFLTVQTQKSVPTLNFLSANALNLVQFRKLLFGKRLKKSLQQKLDSIPPNSSQEVMIARINSS